jgi:2-hydroxy-3-keto-5-methylthiopentenyl-1-phosphate phosphatase
VIDFDRAVCGVDEVEFLVERLGAPGWCELHSAAVAHHDHDHRRLLDAWESIAADESTLRAVASAVPIAPDFAPLVERVRAAGAKVVVVADGFGLVVERACAGLDVEVRTNRIDFKTGRLQLRQDGADVDDGPRVVRFGTLAQVRAALAEVAV